MCDSWGSSIDIVSVHKLDWMMMPERVAVVKNPGFFNFFGKRGDLVLRLSCALPRACCVSMCNVHVLRFSKWGLRFSNFVLGIFQFFALGFFLFSPQNCCLLKASLGIMDA